jgi:hypothetical protein
MEQARKHVLRVEVAKGSQRLQRPSKAVKGRRRELYLTVVMVILDREQLD